MVACTEAGTALHRLRDRFAVVAHDAFPTRDI
jgi:hypothetical protein